MSNDARFFRNSMLHKALDVLSRTPMTEQELKRAIQFTASVPRFNQHIIIPLSNNGMTKRRDSVYHLTPVGEETLQTLGRIKIRMPNAGKFMPSGDYDGAELMIAAVRNGADDHMQLPSRVGDKLFYRDGRVEAL